MTIAWLLIYEGNCDDPAALADAFAARFGDALRALPGAEAADLYSAVDARDPLLGEEIGPVLLVRVRFAAVLTAEHALARAADLDLAGFHGPPPFQGRVRHELMTEDRYPVASDTAMSGPHGTVSYFVLYDGPAADEAAFRDYYHANHPPILGRLPGVRSTMLGTPVDWRDPLGIADAGHMHLCDISFDSPAALNAALASSVRTELREDFGRFPPCEGAVIHQAMVRRPL
jgi:uncharacterized protein (TIGR02118 family)